MSDASLCFQSAVELTRMIRGKEVSAREVMEAHLARIEKVNPKVNAIVTMDAEGALEGADAADTALANGESLGILHGLPMGVKDLRPTKGMRTTYGSPLYADHVPGADAIIVERERATGAIIVGKTNTPEFGAGSQTFNTVFGATRNPYDLGMTCGGSSGGSAVALACNMLPLADGSDSGGSLRNPAAFCNVVGFRTSPGRVPVWPGNLGWWTISVLGPMARNVSDAALFLAAIAGPDARAPISIEEPGERFLEPLQREFKGVRVAFSRDLGILPVEPEVAEVCESGRKVLEALGCVVDDGHPDMHDADEIFQVLRAWQFSLEHGERLAKHRDQLKDTIIWNTETGLALNGPTVAKAEAARTAFYHRVREFLEDYEYLVLPVNPVAPFPVDQPYVTEINGQKMETYIDWMRFCYAITITGLPAISVPCGFTPQGLPVGLQIVGRHNRDFEVLQLAKAFEEATGHGSNRPDLAEG
ncbi:MAG: amidase [SAR324 cluster bacterium]|nr:amidase [SAR324 cluster bacterium]